MGNKEIIIVGLGEVGEPIKKLEEEAGNVVSVVEINDRPTPSDKIYDVMHVCIPDSHSFATIVLNYIDDYSPGLVIIHSTVAPGTTSKINRDIDTHVVHSPIRGVHPNLYEGIKTFVKNIGGELEASSLAHKHMVSL